MVEEELDAPLLAPDPAAPAPDAPEDAPDDAPAVDADATGCLANDRPGASADTRAAKPAVSAAAATITHRRVRTTRSMAASRASAARDLVVLPFIRCSSRIMTRLSAKRISP